MLMQLFQIVVRAISGRISAQVSIRVEQQITASVDEKLVTVTSVNVVMSMEKNHFTTSIVVNCKDHTLPAEVTDFDLYKSFDAALDKVHAQIMTLHAKQCAHKTVPLCESECACAAKE